MIELISILIVLSVLGMADAGYLTWKHYRKQPLVCPLNESCSIVTESKWAKIFFVRNEVLGILYYLSVFAAALTMFLTQTNIEIFLAIWTGGALLFSVFLVYVQAKIIKNYCFYCLISALISFLIFLIALLLLK